MASRTTQVRATAAAMILVLVAGLVAAGFVIGHRSAPPSEDRARPVIEQSRQLAIAIAAYDDAGLVQAEAVRIAALAALGPGNLPGFLGANVDEVNALRSRSRSDLIADLEVQDAAGRQALDRLASLPGFEASEAVRATLGPLTAEQLRRYRDSGAVASDLALYESANRELDALHAQRDPFVATLSASVADLEKAPRPGEAAPPWEALAGIALAVLALEVAFAVLFVRFDAGVGTEVRAEAERHNEQLVSMFLVARRLTSGRPGPGFAATVAEEASWTTGADFAFVMVLDDDFLDPVATYGDAVPARLGATAGLLGRTVDAIAAQHASVPQDPSLPDERGPLTIAAAPIVMQHRVAGVLVAGRRGDRAFRTDEATALTLLAHVAGTSLERVSTGWEATGDRALARGTGPAAPSSTNGRVARAGRKPSSTSNNSNPMEVIEDFEDFEVVGGPAAPAVDVDLVDAVDATYPVADPVAHASAAIRAVTEVDPAVWSDRRWPASLDGAANVVRVLVPDVLIRRHGEPAKLPGSSARLLAVLVAQRQPVTVDKLADLLWPEIDIDAGRNRLNVTVHRLRKALDLPNDELLVRSADGIALVPGSGWVIDSWSFWDLSGATVDPVAQVEAFELYQADFCARQFAYEDAVGIERDRLRARWADLTRRLLDGMLVNPTVAADRALAFGIVDRDVLLHMAVALDRAGHTAEATTLSQLADDGRHIG